LRLICRNSTLAGTANTVDSIVAGRLDARQFDSQSNISVVNQCFFEHTLNVSKGKHLMEQVFLKTTGLTKSYGSQIALDKADVTIRSGDVYGLVGQNGAGKTTLIRLICGLTFPSAGTVELMGETSEAGLCQARSRVGSIIESPRFYPNLTARQNLEYFRLQRGIPERSCVDKALETVHLADTGSKKFCNFSLGMKQRLGLALAILKKPNLIILDEPTNGLDPMGIIEIRDIIRGLASEGTSFLISSHILSELSQVATRYGFIHRGTLLLQASEQELASKSRRALQLKVTDAAAAATVLETQVGLRDYQVVDTQELRLYAHLDNPSRIVEALVTAGITVNGFAEVGDSLEDFYTTLIEEKAR
jgi:ABC-2 type transport system ATP-binding protein